MSIEIRILREEEQLKMNDGVVLDGFPTIGLINAIASECLIRTAGTQLYAAVESPQFPSLSVINNYAPQFPARLHVNESLKVAFFISEFNIDPSLQNELGKVILNWAEKNKCKMVVSAAGISGHKRRGVRNKDITVSTNDQQIYAAASTKSAAAIAKQNGFVVLKSGWVGGIPATLLNEGSISKMDVIVLLVNTINDVPDFRASALISSAITKLVPGLHCDTNALIGEAQTIETKMKQVRDGSNVPLSMYR